MDVGAGHARGQRGVGALAQDLGLAPTALADEGAGHLTFGALEPLVDLMQATPADKLMPIVVRRMKEGTDLRDFVGARSSWPTPEPSAARTTTAAATTP